MSVGVVVERVVQADGPLVLQPGLVTPLADSAWRARVRSLQVDGARVDYLELEPYRFEVPPLVDRPESPVQMMLVVVLAGSIDGEVDGHPMHLQPGRAALIDGRASIRVEALKPVRAMRLFVDEAHLSAEALSASTLPFALLKESPLVAGCVGLISGLLQVGNPIVEPHDEVAVSQPLIALQAALLDEALHRQQGEEPVLAVEPPDRRQRIEAHIAARLDDRDLSVASIAAAFGITLRTVHAAFEGGPETVAGLIRRRRVERAKALLAIRTDPPNVAALAARVGLSRDQLTRAFRAAEGSTALEWWRTNRPTGG